MTIEAKIQGVNAEKKARIKVLDELKGFFASTDLEVSGVRLSSGEVIMDGKKFLNSHVSFVENNIMNDTFFPYMQRLINLRNMLTTITK